MLFDDFGNEDCVLEVEGTESNLGSWICLATKNYRVELKFAVFEDEVTFDDLVSEVKNLTLENIRLNNAVQENKDEIQKLREHLRSV